MRDTHKKWSTSDGYSAYRVLCRSTVSAAWREVWHGYSMPVYAVSRTPGTIQYTTWDWEKLHANVASWEQLDVWDSVTLNAPWDLIQWLWFDGPVYIDDLEIVRAVGPVEMSCGFASRGEQATCTVTDTTVEEVTRWQFRGVNAAGDTLSVVDDTSSSTSWSGRVVMDGLVTATVLIDSIPRTTSDSLHVVQRPWRWFFDDYDNYNEGLLLSSCITWQSVDIDSLPVTVGINAAFGPDPCEPGAMLLPSPFSSPLDGFTVDSVLSGPNAGFYFVGSADYGSVRGSLVHPQLDAGAAQNPIQPCKKLTPSNLANWYQYNTTCKNFDADGFVQGAWDHEGYGRQGDNGHQSLFEAAAAEEGGDPEHRIESMVHEIQGELWIDVRNELLLTNQDLFNATNVHPMMPSNFCSGFIWIYRAADSTFVKRRMGNGPGEFQCP